MPEKTTHTDNNNNDGHSAVLFWIAVPLAFALGAWFSYLVLQNYEAASASKLQDVRQDLTEMRDSYRACRTKLETAIRERDKAVAERKKAIQTAQKARENLGDAAGGVEELRAEKQEAEQKVTELQDHIAQLRNEISDLRTANNSLQQRLAEVARAQSRPTDTRESSSTQSAPESTGTETASAGTESEPAGTETGTAATEPGESETASAAPPTSPSTAAEDAKELKILSADAEVTERNDTFWQYSWEIRLRNQADQPLKVMGQILFTDSNKDRVGGSPIEVTLQPGQTRTVSGDCLIRSSLAPKVKQYSVTVSEVPS